VVENLGPVIERSIGGYDYGCPLTAKADDLEQEICSGLVEGQKAELIRDEKCGPGVLSSSLTKQGRYARFPCQMPSSQAIALPGLSVC